MGRHQVSAVRTEAEDVDVAIAPGLVAADFPVVGDATDEDRPRPEPQRYRFIPGSKQNQIVLGWRVDHPAGPASGRGVTRRSPDRRSCSNLAGGRSSARPISTARARAARALESLSPLPAETDGPRVVEIQVESIECAKIGFPFGVRLVPQGFVCPRFLDVELPGRDGEPIATIVNRAAATPGHGLRRHQRQAVHAASPPCQDWPTLQEPPEVLAQCSGGRSQLARHLLDT